MGLSFSQTTLHDRNTYTDLNDLLASVGLWSRTTYFQSRDSRSLKLMHRCGTQ